MHYEKNTEIQCRIVHNNLKKNKLNDAVILFMSRLHNPLKFVLEKLRVFEKNSKRDKYFIMNLTQRYQKKILESEVLKQNPTAIP